MKNSLEILMKKDIPHRILRNIQFFNEFLNKTLRKLKLSLRSLKFKEAEF